MPVFEGTARSLDKGTVHRYGQCPSLRYPILEGPFAPRSRKNGPGNRCPARIGQHLPHTDAARQKKSAPRDVAKLTAATVEQSVRGKGYTWNPPEPQVRQAHSAPLFVDGILQAFSWLELYGVTCRYLDRFPGLGIASIAGGAIDHLEHAKTCD